MRLIPLVLTLLRDTILWDHRRGYYCFNLIPKQGNLFFGRFSTSCNYLCREKIARQKCEDGGVKHQPNKIHLSLYKDINLREKYKSGAHLKEQTTNAVKDIQGVWKFYFPVFIMDTEFEAAKGESSESDNMGKAAELGRASNLHDPDNLDELDEVDAANESEDFRTGAEGSRQTESSTNKEASDDANLNLLRGERMQPLPMFVYNYENIVSASSSTRAYWYNKFLQNNIFECTIKFVNKMNSKYMVILQGYLFVSKINALNDKNIRLMPCQIFGNLFLANNDNAEEVSLIPPNMKVYDKNGNEVKDILAILEKKIPGFRKDKKKIDSFLGLKKWKFLGVSTAYKVVGEGKNMFNINHFLTGKDESIFYNVMNFDAVNTNYNKKRVVHLAEIFNSYFERPPADVLSLIMKNVITKLEEKSINGPF
ncbi:hypothetical protein C922_04295 [Plasmodium inui San Antonio 1]|uniref:Uncharacterized protein n=1 Tax=Plasmodium inui San Antonio 1 TaxID=1237626 RepID=W6ZX25_9APIC|nr:hypothetical protein C922_04295 [Plasmodium inui San Antonio 1]EUD65352.1 hypothetical protein C922_04295 [Plasmodium inui San Antonio 1]